MTEPALIANRAHCRPRRWGVDLVRVAGLVLLGFCAWLPLRADTVLTTTNATVLQLALNAGGVIRFNFSDTFRLATNLVITNNVTLDGSGQNITFDGGGFIGVFTNVTVHTNADFTIRVTNLTVFSSTNGSRLFVVNSNAQLSLLNVSLLNGHATNGGAILNRGTLVVSNCLFGGNAAAGRTGANGSNGSTNLFGNGGDGGNGGAGGGGLGGAICNYGTAHVFRSQFYTNAAIGGDGGKGGRGGDGNLNAGQGGDGGNGGSALGGAIYNSRTLALLNCEVDVNYAAGGYGGDRGVHGSGLFTLYDGVGGAGGVAHGAGIYNSGLLNPTACTLARNGAQGGDSAKGGTDSGTSNGSTGAAGGASFGGGICNLGTNTMINCTVFTNYAMGGLGGSGGDGDINAGQGGAGGAASGGSVYNSGRTVVTNCTIVGGTSYGGFGGLPGSGLFASTNGVNGVSRGANLTQNSGAFILKNTILAYPVSQTNSYATTNFTYTTNITGITTNWNTIIDPITGLTITNGISGYTTNYGVVTTTNVIGNTNIAVGFNGYGTFTDAGFNLTSDGTPSFSGTSLKNIDPRLEPPNANGGPTLTMALGLNSPAINRGDTNTSAYLAIDQRGFPRVVGGRADIGAFESAVVGLFSVSGKVSDLDSSIPDAVLTNVLLTLTATFTNGSGQSQSSTFTRLTKTNGTYLFTNIPSGSIEITPTRSRYFFTPSSHAADLTNDLTVDFAGYRVFSTSGTITLAGAGLADVTVSAGTEGTDATTDAAGFYTISDLSVGDFPSYEVVPLLDGYTFSPPSTTVTSGSNVTNINFTAVGARVVSGAVTNAAGQGVSNVVVVVGGGFDTTDTNGFYSVSNLLPGIYEVIPFASGVAFTPNVTDADVTDADATQNFLAVALINIGGRVTNGVTGAGVSNVVIQTSSGQTSTGSNGFYTLSTVPVGSGVTSSLSGFVFTPTNLVVAGAFTNYNFSAAPLLNISGTITEGTNVLTNATVTLTATGTDIYGRAVTTSNATSSGTYTLANLLPGTYTVIPAGSNFVFTPGSRSVSLTISNQPGVNFAAFRFQAISGAVLEGAAGVSNLLVTATGTNIIGVAVTNSTFTGADGTYSLANLLAGAYTVAPASTNFVFTPGSRSVTLTISNQPGVNFAAFRFQAISGLVQEGAGGVSNLLVTATGTNIIGVAVTNFTITGTDGTYSLDNLLPGTYTVIPSGSNFVFIPGSRSVTLTTSNQPAVNFAAFRFLAISGAVQEGTNGVSNLLVTATGTNVNGITVTNSSLTGTSGAYSLTNLLPGNYTVTPAGSNFVFTPGSRSVTLATSNQPAVNYAAFRFQTISGAVLEGAGGVSNLLITATGTNIIGVAVTNFTITGTDGTYSLANLLQGTYTVTPAGSNFGFTPGSRSVTLTTSNQPAVNFVAFRFQTISGAVLEGAGGVSKLLVSVTGTNINGVAVTNFTITDSNGLYSLPNLIAGTYTVAPANVGVGFRPVSTNVTLGTTNLAGVNFTARPASLQLVFTNNQSRFQLTLTALPSRIYQIQSATNLSAGANWRPFLTVLTGTNSVLQTLVTNTNGSLRLFFRSATL